MKNVEIRDEIYRNIHDLKPKWWMKWGILIIVFIIAILFVLSHLVQYPEIISVPARIKSKEPSATLPAKLTSNIASILVEDRAEVKQGEYLILFTNDANNQDILQLNEKLERLSVDPLQFYAEEKIRNTILESSNLNGII